MKKSIATFLLLYLLSSAAYPQVSNGEIGLLQKLDSIKNSSSVSRHFAGLYFNTTNKVVDFFLSKPEKERMFIQRLETSFADYFFRSAHAFAEGATVAEEWETYFKDTSLSPLQYQLLGINAHINGDIWRALVSAFSLEEIQNGKKSYFEFNRELINQYREFYNWSIAEDARIKLLHTVTAGIDKLYGKLMLIRWRKRQLRLATLYYKDRNRFNKQMGRLNKKMRHINELILRNL
jgi:hypothetical protein